MRFSIVAAAFTAFAGITTAQVNADAICQTLDLLTNQANGLIGQVNSLNLVNAPLALIGQGPLPVSFPDYTSHACFTCETTVSNKLYSFN